MICRRPPKKATLAAPSGGDAFSVREPRTPIPAVRSKGERNVRYGRGWPSFASSWDLLPSVAEFLLHGSHAVQDWDNGSERILPSSAIIPPPQDQGRAENALSHQEEQQRSA